MYMKHKFSSIELYLLRTEMACISMAGWILYLDPIKAQHKTLKTMKNPQKMMTIGFFEYLLQWTEMNCGESYEWKGIDIHGLRRIIKLLLKCLLKSNRAIEAIGGVIG